MDEPFRVESIFIITMFFNVYFLKTKSKKFIFFKHLPVKLSPLNTFELNSLKIQDDFIKEIRSNEKE